MTDQDQTAGPTCYVVLGTSGEYSSRSVWVSAVYFDRATAVRKVEQKEGESRSAQASYYNWQNHLRSLVGREVGSEDWIWDELKPGIEAKARVAVESDLGPEPEEEDYVSYTIVTARAGVWGPDDGWEELTNVE